MNKWHWVLLAVLIALISCALSSCSGCDDDDDDDNDDNDDDSGGDDDDDDDADDDADDDSDDDMDDDLNDDIDDDNDILVNHGNGTGTDPNTGLMWELGQTEQPVTHSEALDYCANLVIESHEDWRLPTISELRSLIRGCDATVTGGDCPTIDGCMDWDCWDSVCEGCSFNGGSGLGGCYWPIQLEGECEGPDSMHWTSSILTGGNSAWNVWFLRGGIFSAVTTYSSEQWNRSYARCVRQSYKN